MFYKTTVKDHIRVSPELFGVSTKEAVIKMIKKKYDGYISPEIGIVIDVSDVKKIEDGTVIPGDGASFYSSEFELVTYKPEMQEVVLGRIKDITDFGAFINIGPIEGMIHVSQTMDDYVSFSKENVLTGKESKRVLKANDICRARVIAVSYKEANNPKIGLTMRQPFLGNLKWIEEDQKKQTEKKNGK